MKMQPTSLAVPVYSLLTLLVLFVALATAAIDVWVHQQAADADGIAYLDIGRQVWLGNGSSLFGGHWSPLYPLLLGTLDHFLQPAGDEVLPTIAAFHLLIFALSFGSLEYLLYELHGVRSLLLFSPAYSAAGLRLLAYLLWSWFVLEEIQLHRQNPDLLFAICLFLIAALTLRLMRRWHLSASTAATGVWLGIVLGLGYWVKTPILPIGCLLLLGLLGRCFWLALPKQAVGLACLIFLMLVCAYAVPLSLQLGRFSIGESGRLNMLWWWGELQPRKYVYATTPTVENPPRKLEPVTGIHLYEFANPIAGTYPLWTNPVYWHQGVPTQWQWPAVAREVVRNLRQLKTILYGMAGGFLIPLLVLLVRRGSWGVWEDSWIFWPILIPLSAGMALFILLHLEGRYVGGLLTLIFLFAYASLQLNPETTGRWIRAFLLVQTLLFCIEVVPPRLLLIGPVWRSEWPPAAAELLAIYQVKKQLALPDNPKIGFIQAELGLFTYWPITWRAKVCMELEPTDFEDYCQLSAAARKQVLHTFFTTTELDLVLARNLPPAIRDSEGWTAIPNTTWAWQAPP